MMRVLVLLLLLTFGLAGCSSPAPTAGSWVDELHAARAAKDRAFHENADSPIPASQRAAMLPLAYFPPDPDYRVPAALKPASQPRPVIEMPTSTGQLRKMERVGTLEFNLKGQPLRLTAFIEAGANLDRLFLPFSDRTTGTETYAAGRYIDLERTGSGLYDLDFNRAYHPFCYFDARYDCPYPPPENRLPLPVRAGERLPDMTQ